MPLPRENRKYNYGDYLSWPEEESWEIIDGEPFMKAAPSWQHQSISGEIYRQIANFLQGKDCQVFASPFDLRLPERSNKDEESINVLQPDITVVCDKEKLKGTGYFGVPELIVEISSPSSSRIDRVQKFNRYETAGVKEYWIVDPVGKFINVFTLQGRRYGRPDAYTEESKVKVSVLPGLIIDLSQVFSVV